MSHEDGTLWLFSSGWQQPLLLFPGFVVWVNQSLWLWKGPVSSESLEVRGSQIPDGFLEETIPYSAL